MMSTAEIRAILDRHRLRRPDAHPLRQHRPDRTDVIRFTRSRGDAESCRPAAHQGLADHPDPLGSPCPHGSTARSGLQASPKAAPRERSRCRDTPSPRDVAQPCSRLLGFLQFSGSALSSRPTPLQVRPPKVVVRSILPAHHPRAWQSPVPL